MESPFGNSKAEVGFEPGEAFQGVCWLSVLLLCSPSLLCLRCRLLSPLFWLLKRHGCVYECVIVVHSVQVTSNARNEAMFREATIFAGHLGVVEKELTQWQRDIDSSFTNFRTIMLSPLPRVYEEGHNGMAVPSEPEPTMVGGDVQVERLTTAAQETRKRLDVEVIQPIKQWMVAYRTIAERMRRLEALRLELDSRRRTVADLQGKSLPPGPDIMQP